jgi:hypothetical protein
VLRGQHVHGHPRVHRGHVHDAHDGVRERRSTVLRGQRVRGRPSVPGRSLHRVPRRRNHLRIERGLLR